MEVNRRELIQILTYGAAGVMLAGCKSCPIEETIRNRPTRRDIETLANDDPILQTFREGVTKMMALPASDPRNWDNQAKIHDSFCPHNNWLFLPWHRAYVWYFEEIIRKLTNNRTFALPYWNWSRSRRIPAAFWGAGNSLSHANRVATASSVANDATVGCTSINSILNETNFQIFGSGSIPGTGSQRAPGITGRLEGSPHNYIHGSFVRGTMASFLSPLDPLFWAHHNMVEACWVEWNIGRARDNPVDDAWLDRTFTEFCDGDGNPTSISVRGMLLHPLLGYQYDELYLPCMGRDGGVSAVPRFTRLRTDTPENERKARDHVKKGGDVKLRFKEKFAMRRDAPMVVENRASTIIEVPQNRMRSMSAPETSERPLLHVDISQVTKPESFFVRVFLNKNDATPETPADDPHHVGSFAFFTHEGHGAPFRFALDPREAIARIGGEGNMELSFVLVPSEGSGGAAGNISVAGVELGIVDEGVRDSER